MAIAEARAKPQKIADSQLFATEFTAAQQLPVERKPWQFRPGTSGNPEGRPKGSRNKLAEDFTDALYQDFRKDGIAAIVAVREKDPSTYVKVIASLLPKEVEIKRPLEGLSDEELQVAAAHIQAMLAGVTIEGEAVKDVENDSHPDPDLDLERN